MRGGPSLRVSHLQGQHGAQLERKRLKTFLHFVQYCEHRGKGLISEEIIEDQPESYILRPMLGLVSERQSLDGVPPCSLLFVLSGFGSKFSMRDCLLSTLRPKHCSTK
eukprot:5374630-Amphidinium_carterae.1